MRVRAALLCCLFLTPSPGAHADEITDQINEATAAYQKKDLATALAALDAAANLLRQARGDLFKTALPRPLPGWAAEDAEVNVAAAAVMGGGITASRKYQKGDDQITVELMADGPIVASMAALLSSPVLAMGGARQVVISGRRMAYMKDDNAYLSMVADRVLVKISANRGVPDEALRAYVAATDFAAIDKLARQ
jgi:hypothetical protein